MIRSTLIALLLSGVSFAQPPIARSPLKINEVYYTGSGSSADQFIELYNSSSTDPAFLDGMVLASFGGAATVSGQALSGRALQGYKFPGNPGDRRYPVPPNSFVVIAVNAQDYSSSGGLNLSGADWECYSGVLFLDQDNSAPNLTPLGPGLFGLHLDFSMGKSDDAIVLCDGFDTVLTDGIVLFSIIDAVEYHNKSASKILPMQLDQGAAGFGIGAGYAIERKTAGADIDNSTVDFDTSKPSPGYEHGSDVGAQTIQADIFPLSVHNYTLYDEFSTDTLGTVQASTLHPASLSVHDTTSMVGGLSCASVIDSANNQSGRSTVLSDHFINADGIDAQQYADGAFWSSYLGPAAQLIGLPSQWIQLYKGSAGFKVSYPVVTIDTTVAYSGTNIAVKAQITGKWNGIETITVPGGTFECYKCTITVHVNLTAVILTLMDASYDEQVWFARGVGIVKSTKPTVNVSLQGLPFTLQGYERDFRTAGLLGVQDDVPTPTAVVLSEAFPNPCQNGSTVTVSFSSATRAALRLYDILGRCVRTVADGMMHEGPTMFSIDGTDLKTGMYVVTLEAGTNTVSRAFSIVK